MRPSGSGRPRSRQTGRQFALALCGAPRSCSAKRRLRPTATTRRPAARRCRLIDTCQLRWCARNEPNRTARSWRGSAPNPLTTHTFSRPSRSLYVPPSCRSRAAGLDTSFSSCSSSWSEHETAIQVANSLWLCVEHQCRACGGGGRALRDDGTLPSAAQSCRRPATGLCKP